MADQHKFWQDTDGITFGKAKGPRTFFESCLKNGQSYDDWREAQDEEELNLSTDVFLEGGLTMFNEKSVATPIEFNFRMEQGGELAHIEWQGPAATLVGSDSVMKLPASYDAMERKVATSRFSDMVKIVVEGYAPTCQVQFVLKTN